MTYSESAIVLSNLEQVYSPADLRFSQGNQPRAPPSITHQARECVLACCPSPKEWMTQTPFKRGWGSKRNYVSEMRVCVNYMPHQFVVLKTFYLCARHFSVRLLSKWKHFPQCDAITPHITLMRESTVVYRFRSVPKPIMIRLSVLSVVCRSSAVALSLLRQESQTDKNVKI